MLGAGVLRVCVRVREQGRRALALGQRHLAAVRLAWRCVWGSRRVEIVDVNWSIYP